MLNYVTLTAVILVVMQISPSASTDYETVKEGTADDQKYVTKMMEQMTEKIYKDKCTTFATIAVTLDECSKSGYLPAQMCTHLSELLQDTVKPNKPQDIDLCKEKDFLELVYKEIMMDPCHSLTTLKNLNCKNANSNLCIMIKNAITKSEKVYPKFTTINLCNEIVTVSGYFAPDGGKDNKSCSVGAITDRWCPPEIQKSPDGTLGCALLAFVKPILELPEIDELGLYTMDLCNPASWITLLYKLLTKLPCTVLGIFKECGDEGNGNVVCKYINIIRDAIDKAIPGILNIDFCDKASLVFKFVDKLFTDPAGFEAMVKAECEGKKTAVCKVTGFLFDLGGLFGSATSIYGAREAMGLLLTMLNFHLY